MGKEFSSNIPAGYTGKHSTHLEISCQVLDAIFRTESCGCKGFAGSKIIGKGKIHRFVRVHRLDGGAVRLILNDRRRQRYQADPCEGVTDLYERITSFLEGYCQDNHIELFLGERRQTDQQNDSDDTIEDAEEEVCGHSSLISTLLFHVHRDEQTAEILELKELLENIRDQDDAKAVQTFQALKVHLDTCDRTSEDLAFARGEVDLLKQQVADLQRQLLEPARSSISMMVELEMLKDEVEQKAHQVRYELQDAQSLLPELRQQHAWHEAELKQLTAKLAGLRCQRKELLQRISTTAAKEAVEPMEQHCLSLRTVLEELDLLQVALDSVRNSEATVRSSLTSCEYQVRRCSLLVSATEQCGMGLLFILQLLQFFDETGSMKGAWEMIEATMPPEEMLVSMQIQGQVCNKMTLRELRAGLVLVLGQRPDSFEITTALKPFEEAAAPDGTIDNDVIQGVFKRHGAIQLNRTERRGQPKLRRYRR